MLLKHSLCHARHLATVLLVPVHNHVSALLLPQSFYFPLLVRLHMDVYRYFIDDALFMALKKLNHLRGWAAGGLQGWSE